MVCVGWLYIFQFNLAGQTEGCVDDDIMSAPLAIFLVVSLRIFLPSSVFFLPKESNQMEKSNKTHRKPTSGPSAERKKDKKLVAGGNKNAQKNNPKAFAPLSGKNAERLVTSPLSLHSNMI